MEEVDVIIIGGGPSGIATSACLNLLKVSNIVLEREECYASLWKKRAYDRLKLHLAKQYCELPHMPFPKDAPTFVPKNDFVRDLIGRLRRMLSCSVFYNDNISKWSVVVKNLLSGVHEVYFGKFVVVATGENSEGHIPDVSGLEGFRGKVIHSSQYDNGQSFCGKNVLVVGSGNSGMEIAFDLSNWGAKTSIVAPSPVHLLTENIVKVGMFLLKFLPIKIVDTIALALGNLTHGDVSEYGIQMPTKGPFFLKVMTGRSPTIDVGSVQKIKSGEIKVFPSIKSIEQNNIKFENGETRYFDAIVFATGYRSTVKTWLKGGNDLFNEHGLPRQRFPNEYWKGMNGLYCAGFSSRGLLGISQDAQNIAQDISFSLTPKKVKIFQ
ncbi:Pyridine nucleotide-disulfide oxidoreductase, class-II [Parasponia andersonii]|uniref:Flavin-containing monooxygenase n=1 Tax=Parasponia andersonii TaxID=3476 RepID=A0A2P5CX00_PARAD|nr:Pyridine nucleotide-disulfide oxidoreductase, class-II [Parasponia andersonii]